MVESPKPLKRVIESIDTEIMSRLYHNVTLKVSYLILEHVLTEERLN